MAKLRVATRKSPLAIAQTELVCRELQSCFPELKLEVCPIVSEGDKNLSQSLSKIGGKGLFIKELEQALLDGKADFAVHSAKDLPFQMHEALCLPAFLKRGNPFDAFVSNQYAALTDLPEGATVGTSSLRRKMFLKKLRPDLNIAFLRGNINTRLQRLDEEKFDAIILAAAGLERINQQTRITELLSLPDFIPAIGQGALALQCRIDDESVLSYLSRLNDESTALCLQAERALSSCLQADCHWPLAAYASVRQKIITMVAALGDASGERFLQVSESLSIEASPSSLGESLAGRLIDLGALKLLERGV